MHGEFAGAEVPSQRLGGGRGWRGLRERANIGGEWTRGARAAWVCSVPICWCAEPKNLKRMAARASHSGLDLDAEREMGMVMASTGLGVYFLG